MSNNDDYEFFYDYLGNGIYKIFTEIYHDSKKIVSPYNYLKNFQLALGETTKWSDVVYEEKWKSISKNSNCEYFDDYLKIIFYTKLKSLIENCIIRLKDPTTINLSNYNVPNNTEFLRKVTIYSAREFYKNPYLFDDRNLKSKNIVKNRAMIKDIIHKCMKYIIQLNLPTKSFVQHYDPTELVKKVNELTNKTMNSKLLTEPTQLYVENNDNNSKPKDNTLTNIESTNKINSTELMQVYQTMLLKELLSQQQSKKETSDDNKNKYKYLEIKQTTLGSNNKSENTGEQSDNSNGSNKSISSVNGNNLNNKKQLNSIGKNIKKHIQESLSKQSSLPENTDNSNSIVLNNSDHYSDKLSERNSESKSNSSSDSDNNSNSESHKSNQSKNNKQLDNNVLHKQQILNDPRFLVENPINKKEPVMVRIKLDNELDPNQQQFIDNNKLVENKIEKVKQLDKNISKYTSNDYKKKLQLMNEKLRNSQKNHNIKLNHKQHQKLDEPVDFNANKKVNNVKHQLDIVKKITNHTNFQSLNDSENENENYNIKNIEKQLKIK
jgi:hypothetical protein